MIPARQTELMSHPRTEPSESARTAGPRSGSLQRLSGVACLIATLALVAGCKKDDKGSGEAAAPPDNEYTARGAINGLRTAGGRAYFTIHHEAIPDWVGSDGKAVTMDSMTMEFRGRSGVTTAGFADGDKVEFTFGVYSGDAPVLVISKLEKLPADTPLNFGGGAAHPH